MASESTEDQEYRLRLYIDNERRLHESIRHTFKNLAKLKAQGKYDQDKAVKAFKWVIEEGAKGSEKAMAEWEERRPIPWHRAFSMAARVGAAKVYRDDFETEWKEGQLLDDLPKKYRGLTVAQLERGESVKRPPKSKKPKRFTLAELRAMPTISSGHTDNLKYDDGTYRVWLSRMTVADGMPYNNQVTVEEYRDRNWVTVKTYRPTGRDPYTAHSRGDNPLTKSEKKRVRRMGIETGVDVAEGAIENKRRGVMEEDTVTAEAFEIEQHQRQFAGDPTYEITRTYGAPERGEYDLEEAHDEYDKGVSRGIRAKVHAAGENPHTKTSRKRAAKKAAATRKKKAADRSQAAKKAARSRAAKKAAKRRKSKTTNAESSADLKLKQRMRGLIGRA